MLRRKGRRIVIAMRIRRVAHVNLSVDDVDAAARFYGQVMGLSPAPRPSDAGGRAGCWFRVGELELHIAAEPGAVAEWLRRGTALFFFIRPIPSKRASCPTKLAEGLASGLPVVCNRGIGDLDDIVEREGVGVLVDGFSEAAYLAAARRLGRLLKDPGLSGRCRRLAETRYSVELGVDAYRQLYDELTAGVTLMDCERGGAS